MASVRASIGPELYEAWNRKLYHWWHYYNEQYADEDLRAPLISLSQAGHELGHWDATRRRLTISAPHIERDPWLEVMETLRHEMAHQYVDEVLRPSDDHGFSDHSADSEAAAGGPHGAAFARACELLRCSPRPRGAGRVEPEDDRILRLLQKILALGTSPNEHEAQVAVNKARRLLLRYNVDLVQLDRERAFEVRTLGAVKGRRASYELWLALLLQDFFFVEVLWVHSYEALAEKPGTVLRIYGTPTNLEMAAYVYDYLSGLLGRLWEAYKDRQGLRANRERQRFYAGVLEGFYHKLKEQESAIRAAGALVWRGDSQLRRYYRYLNPHVRTYRGRGVVASAAYKDGVQEGRRVEIRRPVAASTDGFGGYLAGE